MMESYIDTLEAEPHEPEDVKFATVGGVYADGLSLVFPGSSVESAKHYKCNTFCKFAKGDRVMLEKDSGTYVVMFPVGNPATKIVVDEAQKADTATRADNADNADNATRARQVDNMASGIADIEFYYETQGSIYVKTTAGSKWMKITGTMV